MPSESQGNLGAQREPVKMQHLHGAKFLFGCHSHRVGSPTEGNRKVQGQEELPAQGEGGGAALLVMRLGRDEVTQMLIYPAGKGRQAPGEAPWASSSSLHCRRPTDGKKEAIPILRGER